MTDKEAMKQIIAEIDALPEGLEGYFSNAFADNLAKVREALAQPEQEQQIETLKRCLFQMQEAAKDLVEQAKSLPPPQRTEQELQDWKTLPKEDAPLVKWAKEQTTPPQRTWVGLTNQERSECWDTIPERAMKKVEAKLKEKNQ
jgi:hypothetical protein